MARVETSEIDFRIAAAILGDSEDIVGRHIEADIVEPAVEAASECISECHACELEVAAVFEIAL